jgi:hypothetical protein
MVFYILKLNSKTKGAKKFDNFEEESLKWYSSRKFSTTGFFHRSIPYGAGVTPNFFG